MVGRCFSLARSHGARTLVVESIQGSGIILQENEEIHDLYPGYVQGSLKRISFWSTHFQSSSDIDSQADADLIGYAILKYDTVSRIKVDGWHVFESVIKKYDHSHNCIPNQGLYTIRVCEKSFHVMGVLYCQQNSLNKACAHVALRSLLSRIRPDDPISYFDFNTIARKMSHSKWVPSTGLTPIQIRAILDHYSVRYKDIDYEAEEKKNKDVRRDLPYRRFLYAAIESGYGGLLGFSMSGPKAVDSKHIIPFYGHTFNKDTWVPDAEKFYFNIGAELRCIPSENWTSSFIGHDDNFGSNFCVPRLYISPDHVQYVVELLKGAAEYDGVKAEVLALYFLYSFQSALNRNLTWVRRLLGLLQRVVLRTVCVTREKYIKHLSEIKDWSDVKEDSAITKTLEHLTSNLFWVIEVSIPQLYPANERKIGEIVLDAEHRIEITPEVHVDNNCFILARFPGDYIFMTGANQYGPTFTTVPSKIQSHVQLLLLD